MAHYAVGNFEPGRSGSPYQFVCKKVYPEGPFALLDVKLRRTIRPAQGVPYLFELEDWRSINQRSQHVVRIVASLPDITRTVHDALLDAQWEVAVIRGRQQTRLVGNVCKTEFGYFEADYHSGLNAFGPGQDVDPFIEVHPCPCSEENPYGAALATALAQRYLPCFDVAEILRAHEAGIAKEGLG